MGYRLHAEIPNVNAKEAEQITLGTQTEQKWFYFNSAWFGEDQDSGMIEFYDFDEFYADMVRTDKKSVNKLYNLDKLKEMFDYAKKYEYSVYFVSY